ncbi:hypothetical protein [Actinokineospora enzanensis]|nr:hypothetical protein [Actinokineospora enzanensis]
MSDGQGKRDNSTRESRDAWGQVVSSLSTQLNRLAEPEPGPRVREL